jgi:hypothetical protein
VRYFFSESSDPKESVDSSYLRFENYTPKVFCGLLGALCLTKVLKVSLESLMLV